VEVSSLINSITRYDELLREILAVARRVMRAEAASLFLIDEATGGLDLVLSSYRDDDYQQPRVLVPRGQGISGWVLEHGESLLIPDAYADSRFYRQADKLSGFRTRSILCAPLKRDSEVTGVLQVLNPVDKDAFDAVDLDGFEAYSSLIATAIEKLRTMERMRLQERVERDVQIASEIQQELLSQALPDALPGFSFASHYEAAQNVGGDFYLVFPKADGEVFFAVGDVSGKGIPASLLMAQTLSALHFVFAASATPAEVLVTLNQTLQSQIVRGMFVTLLVGKMNAADHVVTVSSAGHCRPWIVRASGECEEIQTAGALPLGILPDVVYSQTTFSLAPNDYWVTFTDGLTESRSPSTEAFFEDQLGTVLRNCFGSAPELVDCLVKSEAAFREGTDARDDLTILVGGFL
jgi:sigma-B regulation protein RsbU (phosphoserine phosphatase)